MPFFWLFLENLKWKIITGVCTPLLAILTVNLVLMQKRLWLYKNWKYFNQVDSSTSSDDSFSSSQGMSVPVSTNCALIVHPC